MSPNAAVSSPRGRVLVTGGTGLLGAALVPLLRERGWDVATVARGAAAAHRVDLRDAQATRELLASVRPHGVIHLAGATDVDFCERDPQAAYLHNVLATANLASACSRIESGMFFIHVSTDHLYDGPGASREHEVVVRNHYAMSKLAGEYAALRYRAATVLRVNFVGRSAHASRRSFSDWVVGSLSERRRIDVFEDVWFSPLRMRSLCTMLAAVAARPAPGVFNLGSRGRVSKAQLATRLAAGLGLDAGLMTPACLAGRAGMAPRPLGMAMDSSRFENAYSLALPTVEEEMTALVQEYSHEV